MRRVVVTGMGVVSPVGIGKDTYWSGLLSGEPLSCDTVDFDASQWFTVKEARRLDRFAQLGVAAGALAYDDAQRPEPDGADPLRSGVVLGTGVGGVRTIEAQVRVHATRAARSVSPLLVPMAMPNAAAAALSLRVGWHGPCDVVATACATGTVAIGHAARLIRWDVCDRVLAGATDSMLNPVTVAGFENMGALSRTRVARPFDRNRDGFTIAEGAAVLMLEEYETAKRRCAPIYAEVRGFATNSDVFHLTAPDPDGAGAAACMAAALRDSGLNPADVSHVNAHGTGTKLNDASEAAAIRRVFGDGRPSVTSIKGATGHTIGAAGALDAIAAVLTIDRATVLPVAGLVDPDDFDIDVGRAPRPWVPGAIVSNSFGFGGHNGTLVLTSAEPDGAAGAA